MTNKTLRGLLYSTAILATLTGVSVNSYASEIETEVTPTVEYIAPTEVTEPAPAQEPTVHIEATEPVLEPTQEPTIEPEAQDTIEPDTPALSETVEENQEPVVEPIPELFEEEKVEQPAPIQEIKETEQAPATPIIDSTEENKNLVQNLEKNISQEKQYASDLNGAGDYQIKASGTGTIVIYVGKKTVTIEGVTGEISGIYSINVKDGQIDAQDLYLLSLAEDSYLYATGTVTFEITPEVENEPIVEPEVPAPTETEEKEETPAPEVEKPAVEQEKETPTVEPKEEEKNIKGKFVGLFESEKSVGKTAEVHYDSESGMLNFKGTGYYFDTNTPAPAPIKLKIGQEKVLILDTMYQLLWEGNELVSIKAVEQGYTSQDDEINDHLSKYPVFSKVDEKDYDAEPLQKYEYLNIDDKNIKEATGFYDAEKLGFYYTDTAFGLDIKKLGLGASTETALRVRGIKLPIEFLNTKIYQQEVGKLHYAYSFFRGSQRGGYDLVVIYFRLEADGTLTVVRDFHSILTKGARYVDIFSKVELEPTIEPEKPVEPTKPAPKDTPKEIIEEEKVVEEAKGKGVTPANQLNVESKKAPIVKEKEDAAPAKVENVKAETEENVPETGSKLVHGSIFGVLGVVISTVGTAIVKFRK